LSVIEIEDLIYSVKIDRPIIYSKFE